MAIPFPFFAPPRVLLHTSASSSSSHRKRRRRRHPWMMFCQRRIWLLKSADPGVQKLALESMMYCSLAEFNR
uniref:Uncharacterized protein n=1 Tax=Oryza glumipatula TaxID=40148 RepID=A0A0E0AAL0_9ORYZ